MNLQHSAKGSTWKDHKYIKKVDGTYYYPKGYKGGKHSDESGGVSVDDFEKYLADKFGEGNEQDKEEYIKKNFDKLLTKYADVDWRELDKSQVDQLQRNLLAKIRGEKKAEDKPDLAELAKEVIRGKHGNGEERKKALGDQYDEVQKKVNETLKSDRDLKDKKKESSSGKKSDVKHSELCHHGVLGQRWGVRRYQNGDGTLTPAGRRRLQGSGISSDENGRVSGDNSGRVRGAVHQTVANDYKNVGAGLQSASNAAKAASSISNRGANRKQAKVMEQMDLSKMTDKELQAVINRLNLERNYKALSTEHIKSGRDYVSSFLSTTGDVLAIGTSAASIMMMIHQLKS